MYRDLKMHPVKVTYRADREFPFFGTRLLDLQDFVLTQEPVDWKGLWRDRRDMTRYWTFWLFLYFSFLTLVLGLLQSGLAYWQIRLAIDER